MPTVVECPHCRGVITVRSSVVDPAQVRAAGKRGGRPRKGEERGKRGVLHRADVGGPGVAASVPELDGPVAGGGHPVAQAAAEGVVVETPTGGTDSVEAAAQRAVRDMVAEGALAAGAPMAIAPHPFDPDPCRSPCALPGERNARACGFRRQQGPCRCACHG